MNNIQISTAQAKQDKLFYVVANIIIVNPRDNSCLILKRSESEVVHPGKWAFPGGKLEHADVRNLLVEKGLKPIDGIENILGILAKREAKEECGLDVDSETADIISNKVFVRPDGIPVFMVVMTAEYTTGDVRLEEAAFTDFAWVNSSEISNYDCIDSVPDDAKRVLEAYEGGKK